MQGPGHPHEMFKVEHVDHRHPWNTASWPHFVLRKHADPRRGIPRIIGIEPRKLCPEECQRHYAKWGFHIR